MPVDPDEDEGKIAFGESITLVRVGAPSKKTKTPNESEPTRPLKVEASRGEKKELEK